MASPGIVRSRILVVDDDPLVADSVRRMLEFDGHEVEVAQSAEQALAAFGEHTFDLALIDYEMPKMKGNQLAGAIKTMFPGQPIVMFTGYAEALQSEPGVSSGVDLILAKPFNLDDLRQTIAKFPPR